MKVEHELHSRRKGRNTAVLLVLLGFVALVFALTVVKVSTLGELGVEHRMDGPVQSEPDPDYQPEAPSE